jgi:hypothetical protein
MKGEVLRSIVKAIMKGDLSEFLGESYFTKRPAKVKKDLENEYKEFEKAIMEETEN